MQIVKHNHWLLIGFIIIMACTSCQKVIDLNLSNATPQLVIEGNVTNQLAVQTVIISQTVPFTNVNKYPPVSGATVTVNDSKGNTYTFIEGATKGTYTSPKFAGKTGVTYTLTVQVNGVTYTGSSTMPAPVYFDPLTYSSNVFANTSSYLVTVNYQDPPNVANQYRFVLFINGVQENTVFAVSDYLSNGNYVNLGLYEFDTQIVSGDTITIWDECIDNNIYLYWFSLSQQEDNGSGSGATPANPPSNLSNNALGYFSAHTLFTQTIVVK